jgi:hypothetical protein
LSASCYNGPTVQFTVHGGYWSNQESINLYLNNSLVTIIASGHGGFFSRNLTAANMTNGVHVVRATSTSASYQVSFTVPCETTPTPSPTPTVLASATPTAVPPTLTITPSHTPTVTATPSATRTPTITATPSATRTPTATATPSPTGIPGQAAVWLDASCYTGSTIHFVVSGSGWNSKEQILIYLGESFMAIIPSGHTGSFTENITAVNVQMGTHEVTVRSSTEEIVETFVTPCPSTQGDLVVLNVELLILLLPANFLWISFLMSHQKP